MPNKIFKAMALGIPCITNLEPELIHECDCGLAVDYHDEESIRAAIISLRDNEFLRGRLGKNGQAAFLQTYNWSNMEERLLGTYNNLLRKCES